MCIFLTFYTCYNDCAQDDNTKDTHGLFYIYVRVGENDKNYTIELLKNITITPPKHHKKHLKTP